MKCYTGLRSTLAIGFMAVLLSLHSIGVSAAESNYAMMMPRAAQSLLLDVAVAGGRLVAVGERGHILYSEDDGASWTQARVPSKMMLTRVFFADNLKGWAVGHDGNVLFSEDGGITWVLQRDGVHEQAIINEQRLGRAREHLAELQEQLDAFEGDDEAKAELQTALEEAEYKVDDATITMEDPVFPPPLMDVWFANDQEGWASGAYGSLLRTTNGGRSWQDWAHQVDNPDALHLNGVVGAPDGTLYLASEWGTVYRSTDNGQHWEALETGYEGSFFGVVVNPASNSVFAYGLLGTIYRSTDQGESWSEVPSQARASLFGGEGSADGSVIFVGQGGTVTLSTDDGDSFTPLLQPTRAGVYGVARLDDGRYAGAGDGGSRILDNKGATSGKESK